MNRSKNADFAERLSTAADAKKAQLERAARARSAAESPTASSGEGHGRRSGWLAMPASPSEKPPSWPMKLVRLLPWPLRKPPKLPLVRRL